MKDTLEDWAPFIAACSSATATDSIFEWLSPLNRKRFDQQSRRLERIISWKSQANGAKQIQRDRGRKSRIVGRLFERLLRLLCDGNRAITAQANVRTTTSEVDLLLQVEPLGILLIPMLRDAGTHLIGEAKCHAKPPSSQLADEFVGFLQKHNARLGLLFVNCTSRRVHADCRFSIALHWKDGFEIVPMGRKQLEEIRQGAPFLRVLRDQHTLAKNHATKLAI